MSDPAALPAGCRAGTARRSRQVVRAAAADQDVGTAGLAAIGLGLVANPICLWSEYTLKTTGAGLPPGPGGNETAAGDALAPLLAGAGHRFTPWPLHCLPALQAALWVPPRA